MDSYHLLNGVETMRYLILTKKHLITAGCAALALIIGAAISVNVFAKQERLLPIYCVQTEEKKVALTFLVKMLYQNQLKKKIILVMYHIYFLE